MRASTSYSLVAGLLAAATVSADTIEKYTNQTQFVLKTNPRGENASEFENLFVHWDLSSTRSALTLLPSYKNASSFSIIPDLGSPLSSGNTDEYVSLYPPGTNLTIYDNGTSIARDVNGTILTNDGPGDLWTVWLGTEYTTLDADPTENYGLNFDNTRFLSWAACKEPTTEEPDRKVVYWQRAPGNIYQPEGCVLMWLDPTPYNYTAITGSLAANPTAK